jgi:hypothetical protein
MKDQTFSAIPYDPDSNLLPVYCDAFVFGMPDGAFISFWGKRDPILCLNDEEYSEVFNMLLREGLTIIDVYDGNVFSHIPQKDLSSILSAEDRVAFLKQKAMVRIRSLADMEANT